MPPDPLARSLRRPPTPAPTTPTTQPAPPPGGTNNSFIPLFTVRFQHGYYDATGGECPDFKVVPTPDCASLMTSLGMIFRDQGTGFRVFISQARVAAMIGYVSNHGSDATMGAGYWTWLSFLLVPTNPHFVGLTHLPITTNPMQQNLHASNLQTTTRNGELVLSDGTGQGQGAFYPVSGPAISVPVTPGYSPVLTNLSGAVVCSDGAHRPPPKQPSASPAGLSGFIRSLSSAVQAVPWHRPPAIPPP